MFLHRIDNPPFQKSLLPKAKTNNQCSAAKCTSQVLVVILVTVVAVTRDTVAVAQAQVPDRNPRFHKDRSLHRYPRLYGKSLFARNATGISAFSNCHNGPRIYHGQGAPASIETSIAPASSLSKLALLDCHYLPRGGGVRFVTPEFAKDLFPNIDGSWSCLQIMFGKRHERG